MICDFYNSPLLQIYTLPSTNCPCEAVNQKCLELHAYSKTQHPESESNRNLNRRPIRTFWHC